MLYNLGLCILSWSRIVWFLYKPSRFKMEKKKQLGILAPSISYNLKLLRPAGETPSCSCTVNSSSFATSAFQRIPVSGHWFMGIFIYHRKILQMMCWYLIDLDSIKFLSDSSQIFYCSRPVFDRQAQSRIFASVMAHLPLPSAWALLLARRSTWQIFCRAIEPHMFSRCHDMKCLKIHPCNVVHVHEFMFPSSSYIPEKPLPAHPNSPSKRKRLVALSVNQQVLPAEARLQLIFHHL